MNRSMLTVIALVLALAACNKQEKPIEVDCLFPDGTRTLMDIRQCNAVQEHAIRNMKQDLETEKELRIRNEVFIEQLLYQDQAKPGHSGIWLCADEDPPEGYRLSCTMLHVLGEPDTEDDGSFLNLPPFGSFDD